MTKNSISRLAHRVLRNNDDSQPDSSLLRDPVALSQEPRSHVQFKLPPENIPLEIPRPPSPLETKAPNVLLPRLSRHARRKLAAARRWNNEVLPSLIQPFMEYERITHSGSVPLPSANGNDHFLCDCLQKQQLLILCTYFDRKSGVSPRHTTILIKECAGIEYVTLEVCVCHTAPVQLIKRGLFPCAPVHPTLAVDLAMLEFVAGLFVHLPPNERAWASNLSNFLKKRGYQLRTSVSLGPLMLFEPSVFKISLFRIHFVVDSQMLWPNIKYLSI
jgi:hypothetical protein